MLKDAVELLFSEGVLQEALEEAFKCDSFRGAMLTNHKRAFAILENKLYQTIERKEKNND